MPLKHLDDFVVMNRPVQNEVVFLGGDENCVFMVGMGQLLDFVVFNEEFLEDLAGPGVVYVEGAAVGHIQ
jgi:hypothetical protein